MDNILIKNNYEIIYVVIAYIYIGLGICFMGIDKRIPTQYIVLVVYFVFKMVTLYDKCTLTYLECKLRNVKKENGFLYDFLHSIISISHTPRANYFCKIYSTLSCLNWSLNSLEYVIEIVDSSRVSIFSIYI